MKFYLDTNIFYSYKDVYNLQNIQMYTSAWTIFEIVSGIKNDKEFNVRRTILERLLNSNIQIIWQIPSTQTSLVFGFEVLHDDIAALKKMALEIISANSYEDILQIYFHISCPNMPYCLKFFQEYDSDKTKLYYDVISEEIKKFHILPKEEKKAARASLHHNIEINNTSVLNEIAIIEFLQSYFCADRHDPNVQKSFINFVNYRNEHRDFRIPHLISIIPLIAITYSHHPGKNDSQDIAHLYFLDYVDYLVSEDSFFKNIPCYKDKFLSKTEFMDKINTILIRK